MTRNKAEVERQWKQGILLWYNQQDYLAAMETWDAAVRMLLDWKDDAADLIALSADNDDIEHAWVAPLLLFLAGCYLDSADFERARWLLTKCMAVSRSSASTKDNAALFQRALVEYTACAQEDPSVKEPWLVARKAVEWAQPYSVVWKDAYQRPAFLSPAVSSTQPVYVGDEQPAWCHKLAKHWTVIRDEYLRLASGATNIPIHWPVVGAGDHRDGAGAHDGSVVTAGDWREWVLFGSGARPDTAPATVALLQRYAGAAVELATRGGGEVIFSVLAPRTRIQPHTAGTNIRLTAHLGLVVPEDCSLRVRDTWCGWRNGHCTVFDDSYEHEVRNESDSPRKFGAKVALHPKLLPQ